MSFEDPDGALRWYVIHTLPKQEDRAESNLNAWRVETFYPKYQERRPNQFTGKYVYITKPLFPRYIFVQFNKEKLLNKICFTRGVRAVVSFGDGPTPIDDEVISFLKSQVEPDGFVRMGSGAKLGDKVMVNSGALKNLTGIFEREIKDNNRVMILLETVSFQCHIAVERDVLRRVG
jgi:transcriptional antiterminator RfaH